MATARTVEIAAALARRRLSGLTRSHPAVTVLLALALVAAGAVATFQAGARIAHDRGPADGRLEIAVGWALHDVRVRVDGRDVSASMRGEGRRMRLAGTRLRDGRHDVTVTAARPLGLAGRVVRRWSVDVDSTAPRVATFAVQRNVRRARVLVSGRTEPGATVRAGTAGGPHVAGAAGPNGVYRLPVTVREGANAVRLTVSDRAGNSTRAVRRVTRDTVAPRLGLDRRRRRADTSTPTISGSVEDRGHASVQVFVDGRQATARSTPVRDGRFRARLDPLHEGAHDVVVHVRDAAGNERRRKQRMLVDSTDELGSATIGLGATGADARRLLTLLRRHGGLRGGGRETIGPAAIQAVRRFQRRKELAVDGLVGPDVRTALLGGLPARVEIDLSTYTLTLVRGGTVARSYPIARGQARYPTPTGSFRVTDKQVDPAWTPPDAPWAAELATIPAGPGNPLGTRWIGTSRTAIGIHGTYAEGSIGTAASHGCVRMRIADAEQLFAQLRIGTPIRIRS